MDMQPLDPPDHWFERIPYHVLEEDHNNLKKENERLKDGIDKVISAYEEDFGSYDVLMNAVEALVHLRKDKK